MKKHLYLIAAVSLWLSTKVEAQGIDAVETLIENERYASAETLLENQMAGNNPEVDYYLVKTYLQQGKDEEAAAYVQAHLASDQNSEPLSRVAYARYLLSKGQSSTAMNILDALAGEKKTEKNPALLSKMAEVMVDEDAGDAQRALRWLDLAVQRDKDNAMIDVLRGRAYRKLRDGNNAFLAYQDAIRKSPADPLPHYMMAKLFIAQSNSTVFLEHLAKAYELDSTFSPALEELYNYYYYRDLKLAKGYLEQYIRHSDSSLKNRYYFTDILYLNKDYAGAIQHAQNLISELGDSVQPRLYKLIAYSQAAANDTMSAIASINEYFRKADPATVIAADFEIRGELTAANESAALEAAGYFEIAAEMDSMATDKARFAERAADLYRSAGAHDKEAAALARVYQWKDRATNIDLFNWGLANYRAENYVMSDSVFTMYTTKYPEDVFGYYWKAQVNAAVDSTMSEGLALPYYEKVIELGEKDSVKNRSMLLKAYGYFGGYETNVKKDYLSAITWFEKYLSLDPENKQVASYIEMLKKAKPSSK